MNAPWATKLVGSAKAMLDSILANVDASAAIDASEAAAQSALDAAALVEATATTIQETRSKFARLSAPGHMFRRRDGSIVGLLSDDGSLRSSKLDFRGSISVTPAGQIKTVSLDATKSIGQLRGITPLGVMKWYIDDQGNAFFKSVSTSDGFDLSEIEDLKVRVDRSFDDYGISQAGVLWPERLRRTSAKCLQRARGVSTVLSIACNGADSWFQRGGVFFRLASMLRPKIGNAGAGLIVFINSTGGASDYPAAESTGSQKYYTVALTGSWTGNPDALSVCNTSCTSSTAGDQVTVAVAGTGSTQTSLKLLYLPHAGASVRWRVNAGSWTTLDLSTGVSATLTGGSITDGDTLTIEVVAGSPELVGVVALTGANGVVLHKTARAGSTSAHWAAVCANANAMAQFAVLDPDLNIMMLGTNDQNPSAAITPAGLNANFDAIIAALRAAAPHTGEPPMDALLISPCENWQGRPTPMAAYDLEIRKAAYDNEAAFVAGQPLLGPLPPSNYAGVSDGGLHLVGSGYDYLTAGILRLFPMWS